MPAERAIHTRELWDDGSVVELIVWKLDEPLPPCTHLYKYRLFFGARGMCHVRYDNERGKGDHRHIGNIEAPYRFVSIPQLLADFRRDVNSGRK
ncbi:MAG: toxin-antitoxin system TumE family protein [Gammaproteobacteria bacterium]